MLIEPSQQRAYPMTTRSAPLLMLVGEVRPAQEGGKRVYGVTCLTVLGRPLALLYATEALATEARDTLLSAENALPCHDNSLFDRLPQAFQQAYDAGYKNVWRGEAPSESVSLSPVEQPGQKAAKDMFEDTSETPYEYGLHHPGE